MSSNGDLNSIMEGMPARKNEIIISGRRFSLTELILAGLFGVSLLVVIALGVAVGVQSHKANNPEVDTTPWCTHRSCLGLSIEVQSGVNSSADPCNDFFQYACSHYKYHYDIRPDLTETSPVENLRISNYDQLHQILNEPIRRDSTVSFEAKIKNFYFSCMNEAEIENLQGRPLLAMISSIGNWHILDEGGVDGWRNFDQSLEKATALYRADAFFSKRLRTNVLEPTKKMLEVLVLTFK